MAGRRGLFGGFNPVRFSGQPNDKMMMLGAALSSMGNGGDPSAMLGVGQMIRGRQAEEQKQQAMTTLNRGLFGGQQPTPQLDLDALTMGNLGPTDTERAQQPQQRQEPLSLRDAAPLLMQAQQAGLDIRDYISLLEKTDPRIEVDSASGQAYDSRDISNKDRRFSRPTLANSQIVDFSDPKNIGRFIPQVGEGQEIVYDAQGNPSIRNIDGYNAALGQIERTKSDAHNASTASYAGVTSQAQAEGQGRGSAPYDLVTVQGPSGPVSLSREAALGLGLIQGTDTSTVNARETRNEESLAQIEGLRENSRQFSEVLGSLGLDASGKAVPGARPAFDLSPAAAARYQIDLKLGRNNPQAAAWADYQSTIQSIVNDSLRMNTGPQTDEDARREAEGILSNRNNAAYVAQRLPRLIESNNRRMQSLEQGIARRDGGQTRQPQGAPRVGMVEDGYRYRGGDPSNPSSWERVR